MRFFFALLLAVVSVLPPATAKADWSYVFYKDGYYTRTDGFTNDGWYYVRVPSCVNGCYGSTYTWYRAAQIPGAEVNYGYGQASVSYSKNWKTDLVNALSANKDSELFIQAMRESGLKSNQTYAGGYGEQFMPGGYAGSGYSVLQQGFAQTGSTVYGNAAYPSGLFSVDVNDLLHQQQRVIERLNELSSSGTANVNGSIDKVSDRLAEIEKIRAAGNAMVEAVKAAQPPRVETHQWNSQSVQPQPTPVAPTGAQPAPTGAGQPQSSAGQSPAALLLVRGEVGVSKCIKCHSGAQAKGSLDLTLVKSWDPKRRADVANLVHKKLTLVGAGVMPPPSSHIELTPDERGTTEKAGAIATFIASG